MGSKRTPENSSRVKGPKNLVDFFKVLFVVVNAWGGTFFWAPQLLQSTSKSAACPPDYWWP